MGHGVTIWAERPEIFLRIHLVIFSNLGQQSKVVDPYEALRFGTICCQKIHPSYDARVTIKVHALLSRFPIALISVYGDSVE